MSSRKTHGLHILCFNQNEYPCIYKQISSQADMEFLNHNDRLKVEIVCLLVQGESHARLEYTTQVHAMHLENQPPRRTHHPHGVELSLSVDNRKHESAHY